MSRASQLKSTSIKVKTLSTPPPSQAVQALTMSDSELSDAEDQDATCTNIDADPSIIFHSRYPYVLDNVTLQASNGLLFSVDPVIIKLASSVLKEKIAAPSANKKGRAPITKKKGKGTDYDGSKPHMLEEQSFVVEALLDIISPNCTVEPFLTAAQLNLVASAAEKYDIPRAKTFVRERASSVLADQPIELYCLSDELGWEEVREKTLEKCVYLDLLAPKYEDSLRKLSGDGLYDLFLTRKERKDFLNSRLVHLRRQTIPNDGAVNSADTKNYKIAFDIFSKKLLKQVFAGGMNNFHLSQELFTDNNEEFRSLMSAAKGASAKFRLGYNGNGSGRNRYSREDVVERFLDALTVPAPAPAPPEEPMEDDGNAAEPQQ